MVRMDGAAAMRGTQRQGMAAGATSAAAWHDSDAGCGGGAGACGWLKMNQTFKMTEQKLKMTEQNQK